MKCEICRKRMKVITGQTDINVGGACIRVVNIPILICPVCGKQVIHDIIIARAKNYICNYGAQNNIIDFTACEQKESEDTIVVMQTLGIL